MVIRSKHEGAFHDVDLGCAGKLSGWQPLGSSGQYEFCLLYTSDAADERSSVDLGGRRIIKKKKRTKIEGGGWRMIKR